MIVFQWKFQSIYHRGIASENNFALLICQRNRFLFVSTLPDISGALIPIKMPFGFHFGFVVSHGVKDGEVLRQCTKQFSGSFQGGRIPSGPPCLRQEEWHRGHFPGFFSAKHYSLRRKCFREGLQEQQEAHAFFYFRVMDFIGYSSKFFHKSP